VRWVRSPDDVRCHAVVHREADRVAATGWTQTLCGATLPWLDLDLAAQPSPPLLAQAGGRGPRSGASEQLGDLVGELANG
jgi:hypothetical protein